MKLIRIKLENIKSYYPEETIDLQDTLNIFVGPNAGGKSNLFEAIQGVINNIIFKHISIPQNQNFRSANHPDIAKPFSLNLDSPDLNNIINNILDRHFSHSSEPSRFRMTFLIKDSDIELVDSILIQTKEIKRVLQRSVANSEIIVDILNKFNQGENFREFIDKELILDINPHINPSVVTISDYSRFDEQQQVKLEKLFELIQYSNVFYELSTLVPNIKAYPMIRYFGPQRHLGEPASSTFVDLSSIGTFEEGYAKSINQNKDNSPSFIDGSFNKLCYLFRSKENSLIRIYKSYLKNYLKINFTIRRIQEQRLKYLYELNFKRVSGFPMKLSSGEREFFNLISGLILTGIKNGIVLMDEPELHLHFQWQQIILDLIIQLSKDFNIQFLIITHSPKFITPQTLPYIHRVFMDDYMKSHVIKPKEPISSTELKDLVQFINTTNNEKAFFADTVYLVEGISDLIVYSEIISKLKLEYASNKEIEVIEVGSKNNLIRFRRLLSEWKIDNYIIADLDYLKEMRKTSEKILLQNTNKQKIIALDKEINSLLQFSKNKLKQVLCKKITNDALSIVDILSEKNMISHEEFINKISTVADYLVTERAIRMNSSIVINQPMNTFFRRVSNEENILLIKTGSLESVFPALKVIGENKVKKAIEVSKTLQIQDTPKYIKNFLLKAFE